MRRCFRCQGRKKMYKAGSGYSMIDTGGVEVDCPLCLGVGTIDPPKAVVRRKRKVKTSDVVVEPLNPVDIDIGEALLAE